jgi:D-glucuronyl C5-epimerase C-terminus
MWVRRILIALVVATPLAAAPQTRAADDPVLVALSRASLTLQITPQQSSQWLADYRRAVLTVSSLPKGQRRNELAAVLRITRGIAARGALDPDVMPMAFLTLRRNTQWWGAHGAPVSGGSPGEKGAQGRKCKPLRFPKKKKHRKKKAQSARVLAHAARLSFPGSGVVFQWYPGMGLQVQVNGTFAQVNTDFAENTAESVAAARDTLDEMLTLATRRGDAITWDYLFPFGGAQPPWTSGLSQATAIRAYLRANRVGVARQAGALFGVRAPLGIRVPLGRDGNWYALYSFAPGALVLNADLNAVIALHDLARVSGDAGTAALEAEGMRALRRRIKSFDLQGVWSRYEEGGPPADLNYHVLNRDLAGALCRRTGEAAICRASDSFARELERRCPPATTPRERSAPPSRPASRTS